MSKKAYIVDVYDDYAIRLKYVEKVLIEKGYDTHILLSDFNHVKKMPEKAHADKENVEHISVLPYKKNFSFQRLYSHYQFARNVYKKLVDEKPDLVWCIIPPNSLTGQMAKLKKKINCTLYFDLDDMWPETFPLSGVEKVLKIPFSIWRRLRDHNIDKADMVIAECDLFKETIQKRIPGIKIETLYFCKDEALKERRIGYRKGKLNLVYTGSINNIFDVDFTCDFLKKASEKAELTLHIIGDGELREQWLKKMDEMGLSYHYHGIVYDEQEKAAIYDGCDYGINFMKPSVFVGLTMKSLDYFTYHLPLLNNIHGDTWNLIEAKRVGYNINNDFKIDEIISLNELDYQIMCQKVGEIYTKSFTASICTDKLHQWIKEATE